MYASFLFLHSAARWLLLLSLLYAIGRGMAGWTGRRPFTRHDNLVRHLTATFSHVQLLIGYVLYFQSPLIAYFRAHIKETGLPFEFRFFGWIHVLLMTVAVILITIGSAAAKRQETDLRRFRTMTIWFVLALLLIIMAIPWPFSPLAHRPYIRI
ncbi:hypothetical protein HHL17_12625 [Chitinophaga sp. G-6-1-13]|uniref:Cytochrome B n=1 Tax=Chitinophaga fulva TaxID=2728842 RepID=A0A848GK43_9BACT|nr:hypothetical protein [Chitinophaga fulva]NML38041.1 hypothetical protein [Chitinophaga fulva]